MSDSRHNNDDTARTTVKPLFKAVCAVFAAISFFSAAFLLFRQPIVRGQDQNTAFSYEGKELAYPLVDHNENRGMPKRLIIPAINVTAAIEPVHVSPNGEMEVPKNTADVGWFAPGPRPGEKGSAVIAGHVDSSSGETGVFVHLNKLKEGDRVFIEDDRGKTTSFVVRTQRTYDPGYAEEVFRISDSTHLNLITCDGVWDGTKKSYSKRLVIFADRTG